MSPIRNRCEIALSEAPRQISSKSPGCDRAPTLDVWDSSGSRWYFRGVRLMMDCPTGDHGTIRVMGQGYFRVMREK